MYRFYYKTIVLNFEGGKMSNLTGLEVYEKKKMLIDLLIYKQ
jgi:hypothetical protein